MRPRFNPKNWNFILYLGYTMARSKTISRYWPFKDPLPHGNLPSTWKHSHCNFAEKFAINNCMCKTLKMEIPAEHDLLFFKSSKHGEEGEQLGSGLWQWIGSSEWKALRVRQTCVCVRCMKFQRVVRFRRSLWWLRLMNSACMVIPTQKLCLMIQT